MKGLEAAFADSSDFFNVFRAPTSRYSITDHQRTTTKFTDIFGMHLNQTLASLVKFVKPQVHRGTQIPQGLAERQLRAVTVTELTNAALRRTVLSGEMAGDLGGFSHGCLLSSIFNMISTWFHHRKVPIWRTWIHCFSSLQKNARA